MKDLLNPSSFNTTSTFDPMVEACNTLTKINQMFDFLDDLDPTTIVSQMRDVLNTPEAEEWRREGVTSWTDNQLSLALGWYIVTADPIELACTPVSEDPLVQLTWQVFCEEKSENSFEDDTDLCDNPWTYFSLGKYLGRLHLELEKASDSLAKDVGETKELMEKVANRKAKGALN